MKKKNTFLGVALLIAVLTLGIGYALTTGPLTISGTATAQHSATSFNVKFTAATPETAQTTTDAESNVLTSVKASVTDDDTATMEATLTNVGEKVSATFTITNGSQEGMAAKIAAANVKLYKQGTQEAYTSDYFKVTTDLTSDVTIPAVDDNTKTVTVTVELIKAYLPTGDETSVTENFDIVLENIEAVSE